MKEATLTKNWVVEGFHTLGKYCLSAIKGGALMTGGIGGLVIIAVLLFPLFLIVSFLLKAIGL